MTRPFQCLLMALAVLSPATAAVASQQELIEALVEAQEASHRGEMAGADSLTQAIIARWPEDPTGYYARAALSRVRALGCQGVWPEEGIAEDLDRAALCARRRLTIAPSDTWTRYILGLVLGLQAVRAVQEGSIWGAYRMASESVDELEETLRQDSTFADAWLPLGTYHFWRGEALKRWVWLPFIKDTRQQGLEELRRAATYGQVTRVSAQSMLVWALLAARRNDEALEVAQPLARTYPANRSFLWAQAEAYRALGRWSQAERAFSNVLATFGPEHDGCPGAVEISAKRGMALVELGECERAKPLLQRAISYELPQAPGNLPEVKREARRYLERCAREDGRRP